MRVDIVAAFLVGLFLLYLMARLFFVPFKFIVRLLFNAAVGGVTLWLANLLGTQFGVTVPINPVTALIAGFLGVPGVVLILALQYFLTHGTF